MNIALLSEYPSQPTKTLADNIKKHSKHEVELYDRFANIERIEADIIYYFNILDLLLHHEAYSQVGKTDKKICSTVHSWRCIHENINLTVMKEKVSVLSAVNKELLDKIEFDGKKVLTYPAPDSKLFMEINPVSIKDKLKVGYVGTFRACKRYESVLAPVLKKLKSILETKIYGNAGITIPHTQMFQVYNTIDVLLMPSRFEGFGLPPLEAALCGRATLGTNCGAMKEIFDSSNSFIFPSIDEVGSSQALFEEALLDLYSHRRDAVIKGEEAKRKVQDTWTWESKIKQYDDMFEETI